MHSFIESNLSHQMRHGFEYLLLSCVWDDVHNIYECRVSTAELYATNLCTPIFMQALHTHTTASLSLSLTLPKREKQQHIYHQREERRKGEGWRE